MPTRRELLGQSIAAGLFMAGGRAAAQTPQPDTLTDADFTPAPNDRAAARSAVYDGERPFLFEGLTPLYPTRTVRSLFVSMRDGVRVSTDFIVPLGAKLPLPVILARTPYDKSRRQVEGQIFAEQGFIFAVQDVRGRYESEGEFVANTGQDREDGYDMVSWLVAQPWCNGRVGAIGSSYVGETAAKLAAMRHPNHAASILLFDGAYAEEGVYNGAFMQQGVAMLRGLFEWARDIVPKVSYGPPRWMDRQAWFRSPGAKLYATQPVSVPQVDADSAVRSLPVADLVERSGGPPSEFGPMMRANADPAASYWRRQGFLTKADLFAAPALHVTGNEDVGGSGPRNFNLFRRRAVTPSARDHQHLIFAAAPHSGHRAATAHTRRGLRDFGDTRFPYYRTFVDWFDHWLRAPRKEVRTWPKARWYVTGRNEWEESGAYPPADVKPLRLFLDSSFGQQGRLVHRAPGRESLLRYRYDPLDPTPSEPPETKMDLIGVSFVDRSGLESRTDLVAFTSPPLLKPLEIAGPISVQLSVSSDAPDTDFVAILHDVDSSGRAIFVTHGIVRMRWRDGFDRIRLLTPDQVYRIKLDLWFANLRFAPGNRVRLHVASAHFPFFDRNLNTGADNYTTSATRVAENVLHCGGAEPACLVLPARGIADAGPLFAVG